MEPMATIALRVARDAARHISRAFDRPDLIKISEKGHNDFVTNIDREAERIIVYGLQSTYPEHSIIGEESEDNQIREGAEYEWIIDPIDGTLNFLNQIPHFCISIACQHKGRTIHGVILDPMRNEEFVVSRGVGCQLNGRSMRASNIESLDGAVIAMGGHIENRAGHINLYGELLEGHSKIRHPGSACLELAYVAAGRLDGAWLHQLKPWDLAAGTLMVTESGGLLGDFTGGTGYMQSGNIVAAGPKCFKLLTPLVRKHLG